jgi:hypothetical protein
MYITIDTSRIPDLIPLIRRCDRIEATVDKLKARLYFDIQEVTAAGAHCKLSAERNEVYIRMYGWAHSKKLQTEIYFIEWDKIERLYMKGN